MFFLWESNNFLFLNSLSVGIFLILYDFMVFGLGLIFILIIFRWLLYVVVIFFMEGDINLYGLY